MCCAWKFSKNPRHYYFVEKVQKSEFFQLCSYPTALAEITDIIMKASEKVDHFVGKNQCNQALVCYEMTSLFPASKWGFQALVPFFAGMGAEEDEGGKMEIPASSWTDVPHHQSTLDYKAQSVPKIFILLRSYINSWFSSHENDNHNLDYR